MKQMNLRLPDSLHAALVQRAKQDKRSLHAEILWLLEQALDHQEIEEETGESGVRYGRHA